MRLLVYFTPYEEGDLVARQHSSRLPSINDIILYRRLRASDAGSSSVRGCCLSSFMLSQNAHKQSPTLSGTFALC